MANINVKDKRNKAAKPITFYENFLNFNEGID